MRMQAVLEDLPIDPGFDPGDHRGLVDIQDPVQELHVHDQATGHRQRAAHDPRPSPKGDDRGTCVLRPSQDGRHLFTGCWPGNGIRKMRELALSRAFQGNR
jgi:hypothetical protein